MTNYKKEELSIRPFAEVRDIAKMYNISVVKKNKETLIAEILKAQKKETKQTKKAETKTEEKTEEKQTAEKKAEKKQKAEEKKAQQKAEAEEKKLKKIELKNVVKAILLDFEKAHEDLKLSICDNDTFFAITKNHKRLFIIYNQSIIRADVKRSLLLDAENTADDVLNCNNALNRAYKRKYADYRTLKEYSTLADAEKLRNDLETLYTRTINAETEKKEEVKES